MINTKRKCIVFLLLILAGCNSIPIKQSKGSAADRYDELVERSSPALRQFLQNMPKGGDLHNHLSGAVYAESYIQWAGDAGLCIDEKTYIIFAPGQSQPCGRKVVEFIRDPANYTALVDAFSMRSFTPDRSPNNHSGHNHFFATFMKFSEVEKNRMGPMLTEVMNRAGQQNVLYLELMVSPQMEEARNIGAALPPITAKNFDEAYHYIKETRAKELQALVDNARAEVDKAEKEAANALKCEDGVLANCPVKVRYLAQIIRVFPPSQVFAQSVLAYELMKQDARFVGLNMVAPEDDPVTLRDYTLQMQMLQYLSARYKDSPRPANITLHAGELTLGLVPPEHLQSHINEAVTVAGAKRIGHGIDIFYEKNAGDLLKRMADEGIMVEINLTSNDVILGIKGAKHPLHAYMEHQVPVALSTDDEGVSRIDLTHEYEVAATRQHLSYEQLKMMSRNSLEYSFLPGESFWKTGKTGTAPSRFTARYPQCRDIQSAPCAEAVTPSEKASLQRELELRFIAFEGKANN